MDHDNCSVERLLGSAVLLRLDPFVVLIDPGASHPRHGLPALDAVVLTNHPRRGWSTGLDEAIPIYVRPGWARSLRRKGFLHARGVGPWSAERLVDETTDLTLTAVSATSRSLAVVAETRAAGRLVNRVYVGSPPSSAAAVELRRRLPSLDALVLLPARTPFRHRSAPTPFRHRSDGVRRVDARAVLWVEGLAPGSRLAVPAAVRPALQG